MSVRKLEGARPAHMTLNPPDFKKMRPGESFVAECHVHCESVSDDDMMLKRAVVFSNLPGASDWEFLSDEPNATGGGDTAPAPLVYFSVGLGFCFMTHAKIVAMHMGLDVQSMRLEQVSRYETNFMAGGEDLDDVFGRSRNQHLHILIESDEPAERLKGFIRWCEQSCMAMQTVAQASPSAAGVFLNGTKTDEVNRNMPTV